VPLFYLTNNAPSLQLNRYVMSAIFFIPLYCIALYEVTLQSPKNNWLKNWFLNRDQADSSTDSEGAACQNPEVDGEDNENGLKISRIQFAELVKVFPNTHQSSEATVLKEIVELRGLVEMLVKRIEDLGAEVAGKGKA
jgi:hypothetical protein